MVPATDRNPRRSGRREEANPAWAKNGEQEAQSNPYGYPRAFTYNPNEEQLEQLYDLLEWTWGTREITFCDPMSGGGSIPFEALRYGLTVHANELNPVASVILKATLDYPARFGPSLVEDIRKYGRIWCERVQSSLRPTSRSRPPMGILLPLGSNRSLPGDWEASAALPKLVAAEGQRPDRCAGHRRP